MKRLRREHRMTQDELARVLRTDQPGVSRIENDWRKLTAEEIRMLSAHFVISADEVLQIRANGQALLAEASNPRTHEDTLFLREQLNNKDEQIKDLSTVVRNLTEMLKRGTSRFRRGGGQLVVADRAEHVVMC